MDKKNIVQIGIPAFFIFIISLVSCQWHTIEPLEVDIINPDTADTVSFSTDIQPIFDDSCNACHNNKSPILTDAVSYSNLTSGGYLNTDDPESSIIITKITDGHFASYSSAEQTLILTWIHQGANNN